MPEAPVTAVSEEGLDVHNFTHTAEEAISATCIGSSISLWGTFTLRPSRTFDDACNMFDMYYFYLLWCL